MIKNIMGAIRSLSQKGRHNYMKIFSLAIGFAVGLILIAKVCFEQSYDNFYPDNDRIYQIHEKYAQGDEEDMRMCPAVLLSGYGKSCRRLKQPPV